MDALALLCTLHAEGPRTLRLLREAGCRDVREFLALDSEVVAALLDVPPAVARRLGREGRHLAGRVGSSFLEPEDGEALATDPTAGTGTFPASAPTDFGMPAVAPAPSPAPPVEPAPTETVGSVRPLKIPDPVPAADVGKNLSATEREILDKVLKRWGESEPARPLDGAMESGEGPEPETPPTPEPVESAPAPRLEIPGVPHASIVALEAAGFTAASAVADANTMALASAIGCPFGDARRFQFLAARCADLEPADAVAEAPPKPEGTPRISERFIERPAPEAAAVPTIEPTPEIRSTTQASPVPAMEPAGVSSLSAPDPAPSRETPKTVLNWDFIDRGATAAEADLDGPTPEAGGPFA